MSGERWTGAVGVTLLLGCGSDQRGVDAPPFMRDAGRSTGLPGADASTGPAKARARTTRHARSGVHTSKGAARERGLAQISCVRRSSAIWSPLSPSSPP
jgi:hypothetical protein